MKRVLAFSLAAVMLFALAACGGNSGTPAGTDETPTAAATEEETTAGGGEESVPAVDEEQLLKDYQAYMTDWLWAACEQDEELYDMVGDLEDCITNNDYSGYPGSLFFDGSLTAGKAKTFEEFAAEYNEKAEILADPTYIHIKTPEDFLRIADDLDGRYILDEDIDDWWDGQSTVFTPIGTEEAPFTGELNGNGHKITGMLDYTGQEPYFGFFGCNAGYIHDLVIGHAASPEMETRNTEAWDSPRTYASVDEEQLPTDTTQYYGILCGLNRGTIENVEFYHHEYYPDIVLYPNENDKVYIGLVCGCNDGTISGVTMTSPFFYLKSLDKHTTVDIGTVCGLQTANGVLENVNLELAGVDLWYLSETFHCAAPAVNAGVLAGEAESGAKIGSGIRLVDCNVDSECSPSDTDIRFGGAVGYASGDIELSGIDVEERIFVNVDARTDLEGYEPAAHAPLAAGGLIGWADGNVTLSDIRLSDVDVDAVRREGGDPDALYAGGLVAYCGGDLSVKDVVMTDRSTVDAAPEQGIGYAGGICGWCVGNGEIENAQISLLMNPIFNGSVLYESNGFGYLCGNASFKDSLINCGTDEMTGELLGNSFIVYDDKEYYLACLAGACEGEITVENCDIAVTYDLFGTPGTVHDGGEDGLCNRVG